LDEPIARPDGQSVEPQPKTPLSDLEKDLLKRGLTFYEQFARQNGTTSRAAFQTAQAQYRVGLIYAGLRDLPASKAALTSAAAELKTLVEKEPNNAEYWRRLAEVYAALGNITPSWPESRQNYVQQIDCLSQVIRVLPEDVNARYDRAWCYDFLQQYRESGDDFVALVERDSLSTDQFLNIVNWSFVRELRHDAAYAAAQRMVRRNSEDPVAQVALAKIATNLNHPEEAAAALAKTAELGRDNYAVQLQLAEYYLHRGKARQGIDVARRLVVLQPDNCHSYLMLGRMLTDAGECEEALPFFEKAKSLRDYYSDRSGFQLPAFWADAFVGVGDLELAIREYSEAIRLNPIESFVIKRRAAAYWADGQYAQAIADLKTALEIRPDDLTTLLWAPFKKPVNEAEQAALKEVLNLADRSVADAAAADAETTEVEARIARAVIASLAGQTDLAARDVEFCSRRAETMPYLQYWAALLQCALISDRTSYRDLCSRMVASLPQRTDPSAVFWTAWTCALVPDALKDYAPAITAMRQDVDAHPELPEYRHVLGALRYRAGEFSAAIEMLTPLVGSGAPEAAANKGDVYALLFVAMSQHKSGMAEIAKETLTRTVAPMQRELGSNRILPWNRRLTLELLRDEALSLIGPVEGLSPDPQSPSDNK